MRNKNQKRNARLRRRGRHVNCQFGKSHWGKFGAAGVLIECDGYVLLTQRSLSLSNGRAKWSIPGGALNARWEEPINGAMRELLEETSGIDIWDLKVVGHDTVECDCGWTYTTFRLRASHLHDVYVNDHETRRIAWAPVAMVAAMNLLPSFARYWKTHSRLVAKETPAVDHREHFVDAYRYELDDDVTQAYYDKKGESRLDRKPYYSSYSYGGYYGYGSTYSGYYSTSTPKTSTPNGSESMYKSSGKYSTQDVPVSWAGYGDEGYYEGGGMYPAFSDAGNHGNSRSSSSYYDRYSADNGFHHSGGLDDDDEEQGAQAAREEIDLDELTEADFATINDSVLDAIDKAMVHVGID